MAEQEPEVQVEQEADGDDEDTCNPNYKPPAPKSLDDIVNQDKEDESLNKYKQTLLGNDGKTIIHDESNPLNAIVKKLAISVEGRDDIELDLTLPQDQIEKIKVVLKEGCKYRAKIYFLVQREIVTGLRYVQRTYRKGIKVDKNNLMVGSYGPKAEMQMYQTPVEDAPSGMLARGDYKVKSAFTDDDKHEYLSWEWALQIKKDFE